MEQPYKIGSIYLSEALIDALSSLSLAIHIHYASSPPLKWWKPKMHFRAVLWGLNYFCTKKPRIMPKHACLTIIFELIRNEFDILNHQHEWQYCNSKTFFFHSLAHMNISALFSLLLTPHMLSCCRRTISNSVYRFSIQVNFPAWRKESSSKVENSSQDVKSQACGTRTNCVA